jgi:hypothetical protein
MLFRTAKGALLLVLLILLVGHTLAAVTPGRITVWSTPSFASACIDNVQCDTTPANFVVTGNAWHTISITQSGYLAWSESIFVLTDQTSLVNASLQPDAGVTGIQVNVNPGGGMVCLDSSQCHDTIVSSGGSSSLQFTGLGEGYHTITVNNTPGYLSYTTRPYVTQRGFITLHISLDPIPATIVPGTPVPSVTLAGPTPVPGQEGVTPGRITVFSTPSFAYVCIDSAQCDTTPANFEVSGNAWHTVNVTQSGYLEWFDTIYVLTDQTSLVTADMQADTGITGIQVFVKPGGGTVCLDNNLCHPDVGSASGTGSTQFMGLNEGYHTITVNQTEGYQAYSTMPYVTKRGFTTIHINLYPISLPLDPKTHQPYVTVGGFVTIPVATDLVTPTPSQPTGAIRVYVNRVGSTICMDNGDCRANVGGSAGPGTGTTVFTDVPANVVHTITVTADGFERSSTQVTVSKDKLSTVDVRLLPSTGTATASSTTEPDLPQPTQAALGTVPVLGALLLCGMVLLSGKYRR